MAYIIKFPDEVNEQMVSDMVGRIDPACYPGVELNAQQALDVYRANPLTRIALLQDDSLIGYLSLLPLTDKAYREIMQGHTSYRKNIKVEDVLPYTPGNRYKLLVDSLAVLPRRQRLAAAELLVDAGFAFVSMLALRGVEVDEIIAFAPDDEYLPLIKTAKFSKARTAEDGTAVYSSKTTDRRRKDAMAVRKKIENVIGLVADYCDLPRKQVNGDTAFQTDLRLQAADMTALKPLIEEKLGIQIPEAKYNGIVKVKDLAYMLQ